MSKSIGDKLGPAHRKEGESFEDYKIRQKREQNLLKNYRKGDNIWPTSGPKTKVILMRQIFDKKHPMNVQIAQRIMDNGRGTYIKKKHGHIESSRRAA